MLDFQQFRLLSFDCYGTLIDWESGILKCLCPLLKAQGRELADKNILELYAELEASAESGEYKSYRGVLENVVRGLGTRLGFVVSEQAARSLAESLKDWQPFPDTVPALRALKSKYKLAIISNTDDDLFAGTARHLQVPFDYVITAQQVRSYKPSFNNFQRALERFGLPREQVLHVAASLRHDIGPAQALGLHTVWVRRRTGEDGFGANGPGVAQPDLEVPDLARLAVLVVGKAGVSAPVS